MKEKQHQRKERNDRVTKFLKTTGVGLTEAQTFRAIVRETRLVEILNAPEDHIVKVMVYMAAAIQAGFDEEECLSGDVQYDEYHTVM